MLGLFLTLVFGAVGLLALGFQLGGVENETWATLCYILAALLGIVAFAVPVRAWRRLLLSRFVPWIREILRLVGYPLLFGLLLGGMEWLISTTLFNALGIGALAYALTQLAFGFWVSRLRQSLNQVQELTAENEQVTQLNKNLQVDLDNAVEVQRDAQRENTDLKQEVQGRGQRVDELTAVNRELKARRDGQLQRRFQILSDSMEKFYMTWDEEEMLVGDAMSYLRARQRGGRDSNSDGLGLTRTAYLRNEHWLRREVFAVCIAALANEHPEVRAFREEVLGELFPLTYGGALRFLDEDGRVRIDAPYGRRLADLVETLAETYSWDAEDASWFVLTARYLPLLPTFGVETNVTRYGDGPKLGTITLTVEAWLPVEIVAQRYQDVQRRLLGKATRHVTPGRLRLLMFVETRGKDLTWRKCMDLWNQSGASSKKERYEDVRNFRKAYKQVRVLVLEPNYISAERNRRASRIARRRRIQNELTSRGLDIEPDIDFVH